MNRILIAAASTLLLSGAALAQEPWASSIQTEGSPSNAIVYDLGMAADTAFSMAAPLSVDRSVTNSVGGGRDTRSFNVPSDAGDYGEQAVRRGF